MHGIVSEAQAAFMMAAMLGLVFAGIRTLLDPEAFLGLMTRANEGIRVFGEGLTRSTWVPGRAASPQAADDKSARKFARLVGLLMTMLGLLGIFERLSRLA